MIRAALGTALILCLLSSLAACSEEPPDRPDRVQGLPEPRKSTTVTTTPAPVERTVVENTMGGAVLRRDQSVLRVVQAELLRAKEGDEIFVKATVRGPAEAKDCYLMKGSTWFVLRDAIESEDVSDAPAVLEAAWADPMSTTRFSGGDTLAISFRENPDRKVEGPDPRDTPFFVVCYKVASLAGDVTWYDVAHVEGSPKAP